MTDAYDDLGGGIRAAREMTERPRIGYVFGSACPRHPEYPIEVPTATSDGLCARCRRDRQEGANHV